MSSNLMSSPWRGLRRLVLSLISSSALALGLAACGSGVGVSSGSMVGPQGCSSANCGSVLLTITDADGDFTSYTVDVTSLTLTKADGTLVETLPVKTRVDFAQLVNLTEFLTAATIPNGDYTAATTTIDYTNASVFVEVGGASQQASLVDASGAALKTLQLTVKLDHAHHLVVTPGMPARLALDFNLAASNTVDLTKTPPVVTVKPFIVASLVPLDDKDLRVRGALVSVDSAASSYTVDVEPFDDEGTHRGTVVVLTTSQTTFEISGTGYTGSAGIAALAALPAGSLTIAFGTLDATSKAFTATRVLAASSVERPGEERLRGTVISRSGNALVVRWVHLQSLAGGNEKFTPHDVKLTIGSATAVTEIDHPANAPTLASISVGSEITAFGKAGQDSSGNPTFDATAGQVRIEFTQLWGLVGTVNPGQISLNLQAIEGQPASAFDFAGTGAAGGADSNPASYQVLTGALPVSSLMAPAAVRALGFVADFGSAPPDFNAHALVDFSATSAELEVSFGAGTTSAFTMLDATGLVLNLAGTTLGDTPFIAIGPQRIDLTMLASSPRIVPDAVGPDAFAILQTTATMMTHGSLDVFSSYADFEAALVADLNGATRVQRIEAIGHYDQGSNTFSARRIGVILGN